MNITITLTREELANLDKMVNYYKVHRPEKISTRETVIKACFLKIWHDAKKRDMV